MKRSNSGEVKRKRGRPPTVVSNTHHHNNNVIIDITEQCGKGRGSAFKATGKLREKFFIPCILL